MAIKKAEYVCKCSEPIGIWMYLGAPGGEEWQLGAKHRGIYTSRIAVSKHMDAEVLAEMLRRFSNVYMSRVDTFAGCEW